MRQILMGVTVYGQHYLDLFLNYCLPSMMTAGNLAALSREREILMDIHTDSEGSIRLSRDLRLPDAIQLRILEDCHNAPKYDQLGVHQHQDLERAREIGADYHCLMPDHIYSESCFVGMLRAIDRGHKAIVRISVSTCMEDIVPDLGRYWRDNILSVPAADLATLSLIHIHPGIKCWLATKNNYPNTHIIMWDGMNTLLTCSPHCSPVYIANEVIIKSAMRTPLDNALDKAISGDIYGCSPEDGIVMIELTPKANREPNDTRVDLAEFCRIFLANTGNSSRQWSIFETGTLDPIKREILGDKYWNEIDISEQRDIVRKAIRGE